MCGGARNSPMLGAAWKICAVFCAHTQLCPGVSPSAPEPVWVVQAFCLAGTCFIVSWMSPIPMHLLVLSPWGKRLPPYPGDRQGSPSASSLVPAGGSPTHVVLGAPALLSICSMAPSLQKHVHRSFFLQWGWSGCKAGTSLQLSNRPSLVWRVAQGQLGTASQHPVALEPPCTVPSW